ncbi:hypothetical protein [Heyndrickxia coagulans]|uniref:hypothetical protein n=1 Tax=Heyndrickxia coagulans TaxID=1398 RepID=UPI0008F9586C|nr:hypothetical protein [Heyndrickxia coagulans]APB37987.1 hypothetical protein BIZ35_15285 [Heyndrickxia coagulans]WNE61806.1 hypothetical protein KIY57_01285 [Heyndrickxia coagulans]
MALLGSVDISFTKSTKIAVDATDTAGQAQATAQTASQTATQAAATAADAAQAAQTAITTANGKNKAYYGAATPTSPKSGDIWFVEDGNNNVTAIKHYDGTQWITDVDNTALEQQISAAQAAADNAVTVGQTAQQTAADAEAKGDAAAKVAEEAKDAATKAQADAASAVTSANNAVDTANTAKQVASDAAAQSSNAWTKAQDAMAEAQKKADATSVYTKTDIDNALKGYATTTTVNTLTGRVDSAETAIQQNTNAIQLKADKSTVDTLTGRVSTAEATLTAQADQIAARITKTDADAKYATQTALTATANSLTSNISAVQTNIDNLQVGGRNYIKNSDFKNGETGFRAWAPGDRTGTRKIVDVNDLPGFTKGYQITVDSNSNSTFGFAQNAIFVENEEYTLSCFVKTNADTVINLEIGPDDTRYHDKLISVKANAWTRISYTYEIKDSDDHKVNVYFGFAPSATSGTSAIFTGLQFKKGNVATDWTPAPEDLVTQSQISQLSDDINLRVQKGDVINQINVSTEGILIDGKKVHITGRTTIDNAVIKDAMIQSMTANKLTAGTIDANVITVKNINASNIVTGTLDASKATVTNIDASKITTGTLNAARIAAGSIDASKLNVSSLSALSANLGSVTAGNISGVNINIGNGNFSVDTAGNLVAKNANITGTINATSGSFSGTLEGATGTFEGDLLSGYLVIGQGSPNFGWYEDGINAIEIKNPVRITNGVYDWGESFFIQIGNNEVYFKNLPVNFDENVAFDKSIVANQVYANNILLNGAHSIISIDGGQLYFTDKDGNRIDITVRQVHADQWIMPYNMKIGYHTIQTNDNGEIWFNGANGSPINIKVATLHYTGSLSKSSSESIKANIEPMNFSALDEIMKTDFYSYNYISDLERGVTKPNFGPVIGDNYRLSDKFLTQDEKSISIDSMTAINSQAIKELYESMQKQNQQIVLKMADLEARLAKLEA